MNLPSTQRLSLSRASRKFTSLRFESNHKGKTSRVWGHILTPRCRNLPSSTLRGGDTSPTPGRLRCRHLRISNPWEGPKYRLDDTLEPVQSKGETNGRRFIPMSGHEGGPK